MFFITALWLGILTSISPCPLATNIAAISFISKKVNKKVLWPGFFYTLGRSFVYIVLCLIISYSVISIPSLSFFLQTYINKALGPILILTGMFLLEFITIKQKGFINYTKIFQSGFSNSFLIGALFALAFCPVSAALFFGGLIPLVLKENRVISLGFIYGIGTALPVVLFSILIFIGSNKISKIYKKITSIELWVRKITGIIFIVVGIYYSLSFIFEII